MRNWKQNKPKYFLPALSVSFNEELKGKYLLHLVLFEIYVSFNEELKVKSMSMKCVKFSARIL